MTRIHSAAGLLDDRPMIDDAPVSRAAPHDLDRRPLRRRQRRPRPGELALAHHGVLFLDELPEFRRDVLEGLRQPLEERRVTIARSGWRVTYPARLMLVAAMNPCPCGFRGDPPRGCRCTPHQLAQLPARGSPGPLLDRIDLHVEVAPVKYRELGDEAGGELAAIRARVVAARERQRNRLAGGAPSHADRAACNAEMNAPRAPSPAPAPIAAGAALLERAMAKLGLSRARLHARAQGRAHDRRSRRRRAGRRGARRRGDPVSRLDR